MREITSLKLLAALACGLLIPQFAAAATTQPSTGIYSVSSYVVSAVATNGGSCGAPAAAYLSSYFSYPGPAKTGAVERHSINESGRSQIQELDFPETPAKNVDTWSGEYTSTFYPGGTPQTSTFSSDWTFIDADTFLATTTYIYSVGTNSTCTTVFQNTYIRTGK